MDKHKLDKSIKNFFDERTIKPSDQIWDRLDAILEVTDVRTNQKPRYFWKGLAASFLVLLTMSMMFYWNSRSNPVSNIETVAEKRSSKNAATPNSILNQIASPVADSKPLKIIDNKVPIRSNIVEYGALITENVTVRAEKNEMAQIANKIPNSTIEHEPMNINSQILLTQVESRPAKNKTEESLKPDPSKLLSQVEAKTNKTYLQKMVKAIQSNAESIVANINNRNYSD